MVGVPRLANVVGGTVVVVVAWLGTLTCIFVLAIRASSGFRAGPDGATMALTWAGVAP